LPGNGGVHGGQRSPTVCTGDHGRQCGEFVRNGCHSGCAPGRTGPASNSRWGVIISDNWSIDDSVDAVRLLPTACVAGH
jgi:hypothetical protein